MAVTDLGLLGSGQSSTAGTTLPVVNTTGAIIPAGTLLILAGTWDNIASVTAPTITASASGGGTWTARLAPLGSGVTTTAGSGIWHAVWTVLTTADIASGATITTLTSDQSAVKRVAVISGLSGATNTLRATVVSGTSTAGTPSVVTTGTALVAGDVVVGTIAGENSANPTADADTLNGSWSAVRALATSGGAANTNVTAGIQTKVVTATGAQTYNPVTANDSVAAVMTFTPTPPVAPTARTISGLVPSSTSVALTWADDTAAYPDPTYEIRRSTDNFVANDVQHATGQTGQTGYTVTGLTTGTPYWFKVIGTNASGSSTSNVVGPITPTVLTRSNTLEGGTPGTAVSTANSGGASGDAFNSLSGTTVFDNAFAHQGALSLKVSSNAGIALLAGWDWLATAGYRQTVYWRGYLYLTAYPTEQQSLMQVTHSVNNHSLKLSTTGILTMGTGSGGNAGTVPVALNQWVRLEGVEASGTNAIQVRLFNSPESTTPTDTIQLTASIFAGLRNVVFGGNALTVVGYAFWWDDVAVSEVDWIGPTGGVTRTGRPKVWTGSAWANKPAKVWTGSAWVEKPVKVWDGSQWVPAN